MGGTVCHCGPCAIVCPAPKGCYCGCTVSIKGTCNCGCLRPVIIVVKGRKKGKKFLRFKRMINENPQERLNFCIRNASITSLAQEFDEILPNRILLPANKVDKKVNLSLKNKTFSQIVSATGLILKS
jgi:hypothetical protein